MIIVLGTDRTNDHSARADRTHDYSARADRTNIICATVDCANNYNYSRYNASANIANIF